MMDFDKVNNSVYVEDDNTTTNDQYLDEIEHINEVNEERISYNFFMVICFNLFNSLKGNSHLTKYVIGLILEVKEIITTLKNAS